MAQIITIEKSSKPDKKYVATVGNKHIAFGAKGYEDMTIHKDKERRDRYIQRHRKNEDWTKQGIDTAGYYSRWILWSEPTIQQSLNKLNKKYTDIKFKLKQ
jgi:hypothetical protein